MAVVVGSVICNGVVAGRTTDGDAITVVADVIACDDVVTGRTEGNSVAFVRVCSIIRKRVVAR